MKKGLLTAFDILEFIKLREGSDDELFKIADLLLKGKPVVANFQDLDAKTTNYMLAFLSGVTYAMNGEVITISEKLYLFGSEDNFSDGSLSQYIEDIK